MCYSASAAQIFALHKYTHLRTTDRDPLIHLLSLEYQVKLNISQIIESCVLRYSDGRPLAAARTTSLKHLVL
jgi:hypothetical protein